MTDSLPTILKKINQAENPADFSALLAGLEQALPADDSARAEALLQAGELLTAKGQNQAAQRLLESASGMAQRLGAKGQHALALALLADILRAQGDFRGALRKLMAARQTLGQNPQSDRGISARIYILSGLNNMSLGDYDSARQDFFEAYQIYSQLEDLPGKAIAANRLGTIATMLEEYNEAESYLQESLRIARQLNDRHAMAGALLNLGEIQRLRENPSAARPLYYEASALFAGLGMHRGMCIAENNLGHIHVQVQDYSTAKYHYLRALECAKIAGLIPDTLDTLAGLTFIFISRQEYEQAAFCVAYILKHPAHLQETEQFLAAAQTALSGQAQFRGALPPPEQLQQVVEDMLAKIF
ncbi:MAG: hypothetical protein OHK0031_02480 [Anaerolineales bacterium]